MNLPLRVFLLVPLLSFSSCEYPEGVTGPGLDYFTFVEVLRRTEGVALSDTFGFVYIDFAGYRFEEETQILYVSRYLRPPLQKDGSLRLVCGLERSLGGDVGSGRSGGVIAFEELPDSIQIMSYPLSGRDSLVILGTQVDGSIKFSFRSMNIILEVDKKWEWAVENEVSTTFGRFRNQEHFTIINNGFLRKQTIKSL